MAGCDSAYVVATSPYTARIFQKQMTEFRSEAKSNLLSGLIIYIYSKRSLFEYLNNPNFAI